MKVGARGRGGEKRTREEEEKAGKTKEEEGRGGKRREEEGREGNQMSCKVYSHRGSAGANPNGFVGQLAQRIRETPSCKVDLRFKVCLRTAFGMLWECFWNAFGNVFRMLLECF